MSKYSKINIVYFLQKWMDSVAGQTFMNYAYSWGAAVVILGTLFKLTHLPGANVMLFIGMGTEVFVFFISAFDRPFDKTTIDMPLDNHMADHVIDNTLQNPMGDATETSQTVPQVAPQGVVPQGAPVYFGGQTGAAPAAAEYSGGAAPQTEATVVSGGTVIIGAGSVQQPVVSQPTVVTPQPAAPQVSIPQAAGEDDDNLSVVTVSAEEETRETQGASTFVSGYVPAQPAVQQTITPAPAVSAETAAAMEEVTQAYVERLSELNEMLEKVGQLTSRLATDSEEMENLNRTLTGIARVYEMQLKSASQQITTQDEINAQTRLMAEKITELNSIYTRMIEAMTVNMPGGGNRVSVNS